LFVVVFCLNVVIEWPYHRVVHITNKHVRPWQLSYIGERTL
jgi:hypothetical protein